MALDEVISAAYCVFFTLKNNSSYPQTSTKAFYCTKGPLQWNKGCLLKSSSHSEKNRLF